MSNPNLLEDLPGRGIQLVIPETSVPIPSPIRLAQGAVQTHSSPLN